MGEWELEDQDHVRRGRRWSIAWTAAATAAIVGGGAWIHGQVPSAVALSMSASVPVVPVEVRDDRAALVADRLAEASGRSLDGLAAEEETPITAFSAGQAPVVGSTRSEKYGESLAELAEAELAAADQLKRAEEELAQSESERQQSSSRRDEQEAGAAAAIDAAIDAAIAAARAQTAPAVPRGQAGSSGAEGPAAAPAPPGAPGASVSAAGAVPEGAETTSEEVLKVVRKYFPADQVSNAMAVARCESGHANRVGEPNDNGTRDFGVFQVNDGGTLQAALKRIGVKFSDVDEARKKALSTVINVRAARAIWETRGWQPWVCAAKLQIVAGPYQRNPGPMAGKYDEYGRA